MEIVTSMILYGFIAFIIGMIGKLVYEVQQNKKKEKEADELCKTEAEFEAKDRFQKLAGIGLSKNEIDSELFKYQAEIMRKEGFPEPDPSTPVTVATLATIETNFEDNDPLSNIPMSRISNEAKKKMAEIAKDDIKEQVEKNSVQLEVKRKRKSNPKQMDQILIEEPFVKARRKVKKKSNDK